MQKWEFVKMVEMSDDQILRFYYTTLKIELKQRGLYENEERLD